MRRNGIHAVHIPHTSDLAPQDLRRTFGTADFVEDLTVFNVGGNKYRVIAFVHYRRRAVYIKDVLTHREYDKGAWRQ